MEITRRNGGLLYKFVSPNNAGVPDRILICNQNVIFIEFKQKNKKPRSIQIAQMNKLKKAGAKVQLIDDVEDFKKLIERIKNE